MHLENLRDFCLSIKGVTEDVKWGSDLCFLVGGKMFCVTNLDGEPRISFKVPDTAFDELISTGEIIPAPYMARNKWVQVQCWNRFTDAAWETYIQQSYGLVKAKLTKKQQREIDNA